LFWFSNAAALAPTGSPVNGQTYSDLWTQLAKIGWAQVQVWTTYLVGQITALVALGSAAAALYKKVRGSVSAFSPDLVKMASVLGKSALSRMDVPDWSKDAGLRYQFSRDFERVAKALGRGNLVLLIDDLDRCEPKQIEAVMTTLNFLFSSPAPCYVVLGMDWDYVIRALGMSFKDMALQTDPTDETGTGFAARYVDKIVQLRIDLVAVDSSAAALVLTDFDEPESGTWVRINDWSRIFSTRSKATPEAHLKPTGSMRFIGLAPFPRTQKDSCGITRFCRVAR
jgi:KAP family P-loop domain